jgi:hypothetical protein
MAYFNASSTIAIIADQLDVPETFEDNIFLRPFDSSIHTSNTEGRPGGATKTPRMSASVAASFHDTEYADG